MEQDSIPSRLTALGHPQRLAVFRLLMRRYPDKVPATEIANALGVKPNTLSTYVSALHQVGLITQQRVGTSLRYSVAMDAVRGTLDYLLLDCCRGRPDSCSFLSPPEDMRPMAGHISADQKFNVLFICTGNSARSIFAEAILRDMAGDRFNVYSAGTDPFSELNPAAVALLQTKGHDTSHLRAKNISEFQGEGAPKMDFVFTVCDRAANEECPSWPGQPVHGHFSTTDPVKAEGGKSVQALAYQQAYGSLYNRISLFVERIGAGMKQAEKQQVVDDVADMKEETD